MARMFFLALLTFVCAMTLFVLPGCPPPPQDAIETSQSSYDFGSSRLPWNFEAWNSNPKAFPSLTFSVSGSTNWILCDPPTVTSTGPNDIHVITVSINRSGLQAGQQNGSVALKADGVNTVQVNITVTSDGSEATSTDLSMGGVTPYYSAPYLIDFLFSLHDKNANPILDDPGQFQVTCLEDGVAVDNDESPHFFTRAAHKQLKCYLVLDYTASMASTTTNGDSNNNGISDAIEGMETGAKNFLAALSSDAQVGVYEFSRSETDPIQVCDFSADKQFVADKIAGIWPSLQYWGASRCWDAVYAATSQFGPPNLNDEDNNVIFISDGNDTSSTHTKEDFIKLAQNNGVRIYCVGYGKQVDRATLQAITSSTDGDYFEAPTPADINAGFQHIVQDFGSRYALRWSTLKHTATFTPSFSITTAAGLTGTYAGSTPYAPSKYQGDELAGNLRTVPSLSNGKTTYFLRATYVPRFIWEFRLFVKSPDAFTTTVVTAAEGGLCGGWIKTETADATLGGTWIDVKSPNPGNINTPIPFASFGPILHFDFTSARKDQTTPFEVLYVDNTIYKGGQSFSVQGFDNKLPTS